MKKKFLFASLFFVGTLSVMGQQKTGYFFEGFTQGKVMLKNRQFAKGKFNYDCVNQEMHFLNGPTDMVVQNLEDIDTIAIAAHRFIPHEGHFLEVLRGKNAVLYVDWRMKSKDVGRKGAMGTTTHGSVQAIDVNARFQRVNGEQDLDLSVYKLDMENVYYVWIDGKLKDFRNTKTFLDLLPKDQRITVKEFMEKENLHMNKLDDILKVLEFYGSL